MQFLKLVYSMVGFLQNPNPVGNGLAVAAALEGAGPECIVPGLAKPIKLLGLKVLLVFVFF